MGKNFKVCQIREIKKSEFWISNLFSSCSSNVRLRNKWVLWYMKMMYTWSLAFYVHSNSIQFHLLAVSLNTGFLPQSTETFVAYNQMRICLCLTNHNMMWYWSSSCMNHLQLKLDYIDLILLIFLWVTFSFQLV